MKSPEITRYMLLVLRTVAQDGRHEALCCCQVSTASSSAVQKGPPMLFALMPMLHHALDLEGCAQSCMCEERQSGADPLREDAGKELLFERMQRSTTPVAELRILEPGERL